MMKIILIIFLCCSSYLAISQVTPYTGGEGSGSAANNTAITSCAMFLGGNADGAANNFSPSIICAMFFGDSADGFASNTTPKINCAMFYGDSADGAASNATAKIICSMFLGDSADGAANSYSAISICPSFFGGSGDGFALDSTNLCQNVLPIRLIDFYGVKEATRNILYWKVDFGNPVQFFELQRTNTGNNFTTIGTVQGTSNLSFLFTYIDDNPPTGTNYYRLKIKEANGSISYSPIIVLKNFLGTQFSVYPNPANSELMLYYHTQEPINGTIKLISMNGKIVFTKPKYFSKGSNYIVLDLSSIPAGNYIVAIDPVQERKKIIIVH